MKQAILVRQDLKLPKGKLAVQVAHAAVDATLCSDEDKVDQWLSGGSKKVVLKVKDKRELIKYMKLADKAGIVRAVIKDAGKTFFPKPTVTCGAIGPDEDEKIDKIISHLKLI